MSTPIKFPRLNVQKSTAAEELARIMNQMQSNIGSIVDPLAKGYYNTIENFGEAMKNAYITPSGTNTYPVNFGDMINYSKNVIAYGADPTGLRDSTSAVLNAIKDVPSGGGMVLFPPGIYKTSGSSILGMQFYNKDNLYLMGMPGSFMRLSANNMCFTPTTCTNLTIDGFTFIGDRDTQPNWLDGSYQTAIWLIRCFKTKIKNCTFQNLGGYCVFVGSENVGLHIENCNCIDSLGYISNGGYSAKTSGLLANDNIVIHNNYFHASNLAPASPSGANCDDFIGWVSNGEGDLIITNNIMDKNGPNAWAYATCIKVGVGYHTDCQFHRSIISNNILKNHRNDGGGPNQGYAVQIYSQAPLGETYTGDTGRITFTGNVIENCNAGLEICNDVEDIVVDSNVIRDIIYDGTGSGRMPARGISITPLTTATYCRHMIITSNILSNIGVSGSFPGIYVVGAPKMNISNNIINSCSAEGIEIQPGTGFTTKMYPTLIGNKIYGCGTNATVNPSAAIWLYNVQNALVIGNDCSENNGVGIRLGGANVSATIAFNNLNDNASGTFANYATTSSIRWIENGDGSGTWGITATPNPAQNLRGIVLVSGTSTSGTVTLTRREIDSSYFVTTGVSGSSGTPSTGSFVITSIAKGTGSITFNVQAAPGSGSSVTYDWIMVR